MANTVLDAVESDSSVNINTASDFIAQYTTRQEYRYTDPLRVDDMSMSGGLMNGNLMSHAAPTRTLMRLL